MKTKAVILLATAPVLWAGTTEIPPAPAPAKAEPWITPLIDIRARYEFADIDSYSRANALTIRERLGLKTNAWYGLSGLVEGEFTEVAVNDYSAGAPLAYPFNRTKSVISDPRNVELNQGYLQYDAFETAIKAGRQRIIYDNAAFVGNVGWRQNEQTFDAISLSSKTIDALTLNYAYVNQVNRIFGYEAGGTLENLPGDINLFNASYTGFSGITLGGYAYNMNFDDSPGLENNTFGLSAKGDVLGLTLYGELAWQEGAGAKADGEAMYGHFTATKAFDKQSLTVGIESLGAGFKTPLATVHTFNGFADAFIGGRISGNHNGLADYYISHTMPICWGVKWSNALHAFGDNDISDDYGWEFDSVLAKKFDEHFLAIAKLAMFESEGGTFAGKSGLPTTTRVSIEMNYTF